MPEGTGEKNFNCSQLLEEPDGNTIRGMSVGYKYPGHRNQVWNPTNKIERKRENR